MPSRTLKQQILDLLAKRDAGKTLCPSELLNLEDKQNPEKMESVREAARQLVREGLIEITQRGEIVDPNSIRGPIRLRLRKCPAGQNK